MPSSGHGLRSPTWRLRGSGRRRCGRAGWVSCSSRRARRQPRGGGPAGPGPACAARGGTTTRPTTCRPAPPRWQRATVPRPTRHKGRACPVTLTDAEAAAARGRGRGRRDREPTPVSAASPAGGRGPATRRMLGLPWQHQPRPRQPHGSRARRRPCSVTHAPKCRGGRAAAHRLVPSAVAVFAQWGGGLADAVRNAWRQAVRMPPPPASSTGVGGSLRG